MTPGNPALYRLSPLTHPPSSNTKLALAFADELILFMDQGLLGRGTLETHMP